MLADGTELTAERLSSGDAGAGGLAAVEAGALQGCALCYRASSEGEVDRLRANGAAAAASELAVEDLRLGARGGPARRVRWDVLRLR